jgi:polyferredoxin
MPRHILLYLGAIPFVSLGVKVYYTWIANWLEGVPGTFKFNLANVEPWGGQQTGLSILITLLLYGPVLMYVFGRRAWCRHLCPIGALLKIFSMVRPARVRLVSYDCLGCGKCARVCDMEIDVPGELECYGEVHSTNCNVCLKCTDECPSQAIAFTLRRTTNTMTHEAVTRVNEQTSKRRKFSGFDVVISLLWIGVVLTFTVAGLRQNAPQEIKALMTPGLLLVFYSLALIARKVWNKYGWVKQPAN